ncbi:uncharacterized protein JCM10292_006454 [Rhodotorula paludigena]|uniref:uncharacterized protein n=1 Tax=Rhodotorula paludigena TaxID=86838 RepID=UPI0031751E80
MPEARPTEYHLRVLCTDIDPNLMDHVIDQDNFLTPGAVVIEQLQLAYDIPEEQKLAWAGPFRIIHFAAAIFAQENSHVADHGAAHFKRSVCLAAVAMLHANKGQAILAAWRHYLAENRVENLARWLAAAMQQLGRGSSQYLEAHRREPTRDELRDRLVNLCGMLREALQDAAAQLARAARIVAFTPAAR